MMPGGWDGPTLLLQGDPSALAVVLLLLAASTLVSEDLTCLFAGVLVGRGALPFLPATAACLAGIVVGDLLLFLAGRSLGRAVVVLAPFRWFVSEADLARSSAWFERRGTGLVLTTRFLPGTRLPTYVTAGVLRTSFPRFALAFVAAAALWTPVLVGAGAWFGEPMVDAFGTYGVLAAPAVLATLVVLWLGVRLGTGMATWEGRRRLLGRWRRLTRWEFWPRWAFYPPIVAWIFWLGLRHRCLTLFTCSNPAMPGGGLAGESKTGILAGLAGAGDRVAPAVLLPAGLTANERAERVFAFMRSRALQYPVVLKPDVGERGGGVMFAEGPEAVLQYLDAAADDAMAQAYVPGEEFGVFYYRLPGEPVGRIFSITQKQLPSVTGDGHRTLEQLILADDRAVCMAQVFLATHASELARGPERGERVLLTRLGTHSRGAVFHDGGALLTPALEQAVDAVSRSYDGFWFGRFDLRAPSVEAFRAGGPFTVIELNGVSSEATSIYDPSAGLLSAWRTLGIQWGLAFEIGRRNRERGAEPTRLRDLLRLLRRHRRATRAHVRSLPVA